MVWSGSSPRRHWSETRETRAAVRPIYGPLSQHHVLPVESFRSQTLQSSDCGQRAHSETASRKLEHLL
eukprot:4706546-Pyramimonas_sp.AAC.1